MKKKTLIVLLIIPFIIGLLTFVSVVLLNITVSGSLIISLPYKNNEGFKLREEPYLLEANVSVSDELVKPDNMNVIWSISGDSEIATLTQDNNNFYLNTLSEGEVTLTCSPEKALGNSVSFNAIIYENGAVIINPIRSSSGQQVENVRYYGEFDPVYDDVILDNLSTKQAQIDLEIEVLGDNVTSNNVIIDEEKSSNNISFENNTITIINSDDLDAKLVLESVSQEYITGEYNFKIVKEGINIYNYNDLLMISNFSSNGEIGVLQTNLGSLKDVYKGESVPIDGNVGIDQGAYKFTPSLPLTRKDNSNIELFGNYDENTDTFNFDNELYYQETTYNHKFIEDWNASNPNNQIDINIKIGIRIQKDFYGNGFNINMNNLCFPNNGSISTEVLKLKPSEEDYFFGPLALVTIGAPNSDPIVVKAYGQDNVGMMIDGNNITLNDLRIQNIDDNSNKRNYAYIGTVVEVNGNNNTIKNSTISLGKTLVRAFDSDNLLIDNCLLRRSGEFNLKVGSNQILKADESQNINTNIGNYEINSSFADFFDKNAYLSEINANSILEKYLGLNESSINLNDEELNSALNYLQDLLNNTNGIIDSNNDINYVAHINVNDTFFDDSGLFSIAFETAFNGPYLYNGLSSTVSSVMNLLESPIPKNVGGTSMPVQVTLSGNTRFYDWKSYDNIDITNLIEENISTILGAIVGDDLTVTIDSFFPMKPILKEETMNKGYVYNDGDREYINTMIAYYGGGLNLSSLVDNTNDLNKMSDEIIVNLLEESDKFINNDGSLSGQLSTILSRCVLFAAGFEPFRFITNSEVKNGEVPYLFNEHPSTLDLKNNL